jgi:hypothetical protein
MVVKELRQGLRARWFVIPFVAVQAAAVALVWIESMATQNTGSAFGSSSLGHWLFWGLVVTVVAVVLPLRCLDGLRSELVGDNAHLCALAGLSRWRVAGGKWLTHMVLAGLVVISLLPYGIVRYFFGGVEFLPNAFALVQAFAASAAMSALFLGASGYESYWMRAGIALCAVVYVGVTVSIAGLFTPGGLGLGSGQGVEVLLIAGAAVSLFEVQAYFTLCGLQLARARLRTALLPWQVDPSRPVLMLFVLSPLYLVTGSILGCGFGLPVVTGLMIWWVASLDRAPKRPASFVPPVPTARPPGAPPYLPVRLP